MMWLFACLFCILSTIFMFFNYFDGAKVYAILSITFALLEIAYRINGVKYDKN